MLNDIESNVDYLNFKIVADPVATMIKQGGTKPISIGVSGNWGAGKSSMVRMIADSLQNDGADSKYEVIDFNAWLYQGYEDARLALLQHVADKLSDLIKRKKTKSEKFKEFLARINWFKAAIAALPTAAKIIVGALSMGPIGGIAAALDSISKKVKSIKSEDVPAYIESCTKSIPDLQEYLNQSVDKSMPKEIESLRNSFAATLGELDVRLVIVVDDLDRCLPDVALSTLEAMRLLLMVDRTVFVIAADETMIRQAVRLRYGTEAIDAARETSYFDKLVQIPVRVPRPGPNEVKCYIMMLLTELAVQQGRLSEDVFQSSMTSLRDAVKKSWAGKITRAVLAQAFGRHANEIGDLIDIADQVSGIMTISPSIGGNPRLIKRFLNNLMIRKMIAESQEMGLAFDALVKLHLFERCAPMGAFDELAVMVVNSDDGKLPKLAEWEKSSEKGEELKDVPEKWKGDFFEQWIGLTPSLANLDLRPYIYISQEDKKRIIPNNDFSPEGRAALTALTETKKYNGSILEIIKRVDICEIETIFENLKNKAKTLQWSAISLLQLLHIPMAFPELGESYVKFLEAMPANKREPSIIPHLANQQWASQLLEGWQNDTTTPSRTITAIQVLRKGHR